MNAAMRNVSIALFAIALASMAGGCSRLFGEAKGLALGPGSSYEVSQPLTSDPQTKPLAEYQDFRIGNIVDEFGRTPPQLISNLPTEFDTLLLESHLPRRPGGKTVLANVEILHYESEDLFHTIIGPLEEVVARVTLVDKDTGRTLGVANCIGRTGEAVNKGVDKKTRGLAKGIFNWIKSNYPEPPED